ncbi:MAG: hypothetical protein AABX30_01640 [Nanoarchaeota archaeon]
MKRIIISLLLIVLFSFLVVAQEEHDFTKAKQLIDSKISCDSLTNEQLEEIGDYYMEQMHPGEAHEYMDSMMGREGSESLKQIHINLARRIYCNENVGGMMGGGMMAGRGMMGNYYYQNPQNNNIYKNSFLGFQIFFYIILILIIVTLVLMIILLINKSKQKGGNNKR